MNLSWNVAGYFLLFLAIVIALGTGLLWLLDVVTRGWKLD